MRNQYGIYLTIGFSLATLIVIILVIKWGIDIFSKDPVKKYEKEIDPDNLSYSESEYQTMADTIFQAAHGWGTDENAIYRTLAYLQTKDDWYKLISIYGEDADGYTLIRRLIYELDRKEQQRVNDILKSIGAHI